MENQSLNNDTSQLQKFCLFTGFGPDELTSLLKLSDTIFCPSGSSIVREGEEGHCLYILLEGSARVTTRSGDRDVELAILKKCDFFGEISLVDDGPRSASVIAVEDCKLLRITRMTIGVLAGLHPGAAIQILSAIGRALVKRLRNSNQKYLDVLLRTEPKN